MKHLFIINPVAGKGKSTETVIAQAKKLYGSLGEVFEYRVTAAPGDAVRFAREAAESGEEVRIYACGGDGTLNEVVNGAGGYPNAAVTAVPIGTGNDFVKIFGEGGKLFGDLANFLDTREAEFDLIDCNGMLSVNICSVGLDARVGLEKDRYAKLPMVSGTNAYILSLVKNVVQGIHEHYRIEVDGEELDGRFTLAAACSGRWYGGSFNPVPKAMPDDGLLDFVIVRAVSRLKVANLVGQYGAGKGENYPDLILMKKGTSMTVYCDKPVMINVDGERLDGQVAAFRLSEKKLRFFYPAAASYLPQGQKEEALTAEGVGC